MHESVQDTRAHTANAPGCPAAAPDSPDSYPVGRRLGLHRSRAGAGHAGAAGAEQRRVLPVNRRALLGTNSRPLSPTHTPRL